jgi:hypothetical protein
MYWVEAIEGYDRSANPGEGGDEYSQRCTCQPRRASQPLLVVEVPLREPATVSAIPLPDAMLEQLRAGAVIEPVLVDDHGERIAIGRRRPALSPKLTRAVPVRDGHCR